MTASRPLEGLTVVITASRRAAELASLVSNMGGSPYVVPTVGISPIPDDEEAERFLKSIIEEGADYVVFMTGPGVHTLMLSATRHRLQEKFAEILNSKRVTVVARSAKPKAVLAKLGIKVDAMPPRDQATARGVLSLLEEREIFGKKVAILWHGAHSDFVRDELVAAGAERVLECSTYVYSHKLDSEGADVLRSMGFNFSPPSKDSVVRLIREIVNGERLVHAITFTSPPAARNLFEVAEELGMEEELRIALGRVCVVAVGPSTKEAVEEHGVYVQVMPRIPAMGAMVMALAERVGKRGN